MKISVRKLNATSLAVNKVYLCIGRRGTGKTTLLLDILYNLSLSRKIDMAVLMTPTYETREIFIRNKIIPESCVYTTYEEQSLIRLIDVLKTLVAHGRKRRVVIILDDCMFEKRIMRSVLMRDIHMNGRHFNITLIFSAQYLVDVPSDIRSQVDYVFALKEPIISNRIKLWKFFFGIFRRYDDFERTFTECTADYDCIVLDNTQASNVITQCVYWYRACVKLPPFTLGGHAFWKLDAILRRGTGEQSMHPAVVAAALPQNEEQDAQDYIAALATNRDARIDIVEKLI